jgi:hypothetical protein
MNVYLRRLKERQEEINATYKKDNIGVRIQLELG